MQGADQSLPVFVFPTQLIFYVKDVNSHRQLLTIYNPYDFTVCYSVLSTNAANYSVLEPQGIIKPRCCIDIAIRRLNLPRASDHRSCVLPGTSVYHFPPVAADNPPSPSNVVVESSDKFRIFLQRRDMRHVRGSRDVATELFFDKRSRDATKRPENFAATATTTGENDDAASAMLPGTSGASPSSEWRSWRSGSLAESSVRLSGQRRTPSSWVLIFIAGLCIACLSAPEDQSDWMKIYKLPKWLTLTSTHKIIAAYVLGLVTSTLLIQNGR